MKLISFRLVVPRLCINYTLPYDSSASTICLLPSLYDNYDRRLVFQRLVTGWFITGTLRWILCVVWGIIYKTFRKWALPLSSGDWLSIILTLVCVTSVCSEWHWSVVERLAYKPSIQKILGLTPSAVTNSIKKCQYNDSQWPGDDSSFNSQNVVYIIYNQMTDNVHHTVSIICFYSSFIFSSTSSHNTVLTLSTSLFLYYSSTCSFFSFCSSCCSLQPSLCPFFILFIIIIISSFINSFCFHLLL